MDNENVIIGFFIFIGLLIILGLILVAGAIRFDPTYKGNHTGYVTAIEQTGIIFPNYTIYFKTDNSSSQEDTYCVNRNSNALLDELREVSKKRKLVTVVFEGVRGFGLGLCHGVEIRSFSIDN